MASRALTISIAPPTFLSFPESISLKPGVNRRHRPDALAAIRKKK